MQREKHAALVCGDTRIDIRHIVDGKGRVKHFAINVALIRGNKAHDVFRVDTAHEYLHVQRFWISHKPEVLKTEKKDNYTGDFGYWKDKILKEYEEYIKEYQKKFPI